MTGRPRRAPVTLDELLTLADTIPADLIALELGRREAKSRTNPNGYRYRLYRAEQEIARHPRIVSHRDDWRTARKALKYAADPQEQRA